MPALAVLAVVVAALLSSGTGPVDVVRYAGYVAWALVLPGVLVYRALRGAPRSLVDDLAMGTVVGLALEIVAWVAYAAAGRQEWLVTWPLVVVVVFCAVRPLRRHWWVSRYPQPPPLAWSWAVAAIASVVIAYLWYVFLRGPAPLPASGDHWYFWDLHYMLSLVAEAKHHFPLALPQVASEPLHYHWFAYAHEAAGSLISGVDTPVVFFRLATPLTASSASSCWRLPAGASPGATGPAPSPPR